MSAQQHVDVLLTWPADGFRLFESMMPLGLASLAAVLRQNGFSVKIIDFNHYRSDFRRDLLAIKPKLIGIGGTTQTRHSSFLTARISKEILPSTPTVYGGPHASFTWEDTLENVPEIDFILRGEAEFSLLQMARHFILDRDIRLESIPGIAFRSTGSIFTKNPERINDLSSLPMPARDLFAHDYSMTIDHTDYPADFIITSRGCPVTCDFCSASRMFPGGVRLRTVEAIRDELLWIRTHKPHIRAIKVFDSTFSANREHVLRFCGIIAELELKWECEIRADTADYALLQTMRDAGCVFVSIGFESTDNDLLKRMGKRITKEQVENVLRWCRALSIITKVFFTFGHLDQTVKECLRDLSYLRLNRSYIGFFATTVGIRIYPGTVLDHKLKQRGLTPQDFSWAKHHASLKNYFILETADVLILEQSQLPLYKLGVILIRLLLQGTALSPKYIFKMIPANLRIVYNILFMKAVYTAHRLRRLRHGFYRPCRASVPVVSTAQSTLTR